MEVKQHNRQAASLGKRRKAYALMAICPILLCTSPALAQFTGRGNVEIMAPVTVENDAPMDFGNIIPGTTVSRLRIDQDSGELTLFSGNATIAGDPNERVRVSLSQNRVDLVRLGGTETLRINRFRVGGGRNKFLDASGTAQFAIGGQIRVTANQAGGVYQGSFALTVDYF
jgi:hypothetical protein